MKESTIDTKPLIDEKIKEEIKDDSEKCTIVHCRFYCDSPTAMRIWPETVLIEDTGRDARLIKALGISVMPAWTPVNINNGFIKFTLLFEGLSGDCKRFVLYERIPEPMGFISNVINRNDKDVYQVQLTCF
jgi:hypothetical protein